MLSVPHLVIQLVSLSEKVLINISLSMFIQSRLSFIFAFRLLVVYQISINCPPLPVMILTCRLQLVMK